MALVTNLQQNPSPFESVTKVGAYEPFDLQVARGQIAGHSQVSIFGYQPAVTTTKIPVWENATTYTFPTSASTMTVVSTSTSDNTSAIIVISGLDANFAPISETLALNGTTNVTTVNSYLRINSVVMTTPGTSQVSNVGTITIKQSANIVAQINPGVGRTQMSIYTVPAGYTFYLYQVDINTDNDYSGGSNNTYSVTAFNRVTGMQYDVLDQPFTAIFSAVRTYTPFVYTEKIDILWQLKTSSNIIGAGIIITGKLIKNNGQTA